MQNGNSILIIYFYIFIFLSLFALQQAFLLQNSWMHLQTYNFKVISFVIFQVVAPLFFLNYDVMFMLCCISFIVYINYKNQVESYIVSCRYRFYPHVLKFSYLFASTPLLYHCGLCNNVLHCIILHLCLNRTLKQQLVGIMNFRDSSIFLLCTYYYFTFLPTLLYYLSQEASYRSRPVLVDRLLYYYISTFRAVNVWRNFTVFYSLGPLLEWIHSLIPRTHHSHFINTSYVTLTCFWIWIDPSPNTGHSGCKPRYKQKQAEEKVSGSQIHWKEKNGYVNGSFSNTSLH